jgi:hypothetical protein
MFANLVLWSDIEPFEVIRVVSEKCMEVRAMATELSPEWSPVVVSGGFAGHCINNNQQRWTCATNPDAPVLKIRLRKDGRWYSQYGCHHISDTPEKFHDYNF